MKAANKKTVTLDGRKLVLARQKKGLSQQKVSKKTKLSLPTIIRAESGGNVFPSTGKRICDFLGIDFVPLGNGDAA